MEAEQQKWSDEPPAECELCHEPIEEAFVDGKTDCNSGAWGTMCLPYHDLHGQGLGPGKGQRYERKGEAFVLGERAKPEENGLR